MRSSIIKNYGRRQINEYADDLLTAVAFWRQVGAWRSKLRNKISAAAPAAAPSHSATPIENNERNVIALAERRRTSAAQTGRHSDAESEPDYALYRPMTAVR